MLMFLAFLVDQVQQRCCGLFQAALKEAKRKIQFWNQLRSLFFTFHIDSWARSICRHDRGEQEVPMAKRHLKHLMMNKLKRVLWFEGVQLA